MAYNKIEDGREKDVIEQARKKNRIQHNEMEQNKIKLDRVEQARIRQNRIQKQNRVQ